MKVLISVTTGWSLAMIVGISRLHGRDIRVLMSRHDLGRRMGCSLRRAQQALRTAMDRGRREVGVTTPQYVVLELAEEEAGLASAELARGAWSPPGP